MQILEKNSLPIGLIIGLLSPLLGASLIYLIFEFMVASGWMDEAMGGIHSKRIRTVALIGICTNIYWIQKSNKPYSTQTLRGITISTMLLCVAWFAFYYSSLYDN